MTELRRVLLSPKRLSALLLLTMLCLALFFYTFLGGIQPDTLKSNLEGVKFANSKIEDWHKLPPQDISALADEEVQRLRYIGTWLDGHRSEWYGFQSEEEYLTAISDYPYLQGKADSPQTFWRASEAYLKYLGYIGSQAKHQAGYGEYLSGIKSQAEKLSQISIFGDKNSFSNKNVQKNRSRLRRS